MVFIHALVTVFLWIIYSLGAFIVYIIAWLDRKVKFKMPFPREVGELAQKKDWCVDVLKKCGALPLTADVKEYSVRVLKPDMIFRSNAGVVTIGYLINGEEKTLRCFAKFAPTMGTVWNRTIFNVQLNHFKEGSFNKYFIGAGDNIPAPKVYYSEISFATGNLCLITEYMEDNVEYLDCIYESFPEEQFKRMLDGLATLHARYWKNTEKRMGLILPITDNTVRLFESMVLFSWSKPARNILVNSWRRMNKEQTVLHGDARVGNMMFPSNEGKGRFVLIDWQAVRKGKAVFDLAYFLVLSLTNEYRNTVEAEAVEAYYRLLIEKGVKDYTREELKEDYKHACLCVLVLLSLPMLSGEASVQGDAAQLFVYGMNIWRERLESKFTSFDYGWVAKNYNMSEEEARNAVAEMIGVISTRLNKILAVKTT